MCRLQHPQYRWNDRRIQPRPDHSAGGNSEGEQRILHHPRTPQGSRQSPPTAPQGAMPPPTPGAPPPPTRTRKQRDQGTPEPMFPTQEIATSAETALGQGEHQGPYLTMVQRIAGLLRKLQELMKWHRGDSHLFRKVQDLDSGETGGNR